jgi:hypothetical protein
MATTDAVLRGGLARRGDTLLLTLDPAFQGLPDSAHGGSVLAVFHAIAGAPPACRVHGVYRRRVPLGTPLSLATRTGDGVVDCVLGDGAATLVDGGVVVDPPAPMPPRPLVEARLVEAPPPLDRADPLPISLACFVCGRDNALGLRARLYVDDALVGGTWRPRDPLIGDDGCVAPIVVTALLDEAAFWLGALASGESGMTTELAVRLYRRAPYGPVHVRGRRDEVRRRPHDARYWDAAVAAWTDDGQVVADARITFVAVRGAARRLITKMLTINETAVIARVFPAYVD